MNLECWTSVDQYFTNLFVDEDDILNNVLLNNEKAGLPPIDVSPSQGKYLQITAKLMKAKRILEIGTLGGYSTIWLARALPKDGYLLTLESEEEHAKVARNNIKDAGLESIIELSVGDATDTLKELCSSKESPFDLIFIDADKRSNPEYLELSLKLAKKGTLIICDNVVRNGGVIDVNTTNRDIMGIQKFNKIVSANKNLDATAIQTVDRKGYDGFVMILVES